MDKKECKTNPIASCPRILGKIPGKSFKHKTKIGIYFMNQISRSYESRNKSMRVFRVNMVKP